MPVEALVARAKRLINFFMAPKQSERLEDAQKTLRLPDNNNSSFLAWERLLLIKDAIDIVLATLTVSNALEARKDAKRLKEIQLIENEWDMMRDIVNILEPFFEVTKVLGGSEYATFSYMIPSILELIEKLDCSMEYSDESDYVNFETTDLVFDDNVEFVDAQ
ncbi:hypothetical protein C2G38_2125544 [Gigaspora rosea]|uniref:Uncharacterized protein n=1 Tax=Gigaspora rosea TaxID=44941 RepID=A0A397U5I3_9GLOM|nr:hypothetical protein C2G38_2125544 [Gigaspora rosea]